MRLTAVLVIAIGLLMASCRSTRKIQTAIAKKDTVAIVHLPNGPTHEDSMNFIRETLGRIEAGRIGFTTFSALSLEGVELLQQQRYGIFILYFMLSIVLGLAATFGGYSLTK